MTQRIDLSRIAPPEVVESLDFEAIYQEMMDEFRRIYPDWTAALESDPVVKLLEVAAYREMLMRARINDAARAVMLAYAGGSDLEHLAALCPQDVALAIPSLAGQLDNPIDWIRGEAVSVLGLIGGEEALTLVRSRLRDPSPQVAEVAHHILGLALHG